MSNIDFKRGKIGAHNNWKIIEDTLIKNLKSNKKITFVSFCEMYFYKGGKDILSDWYGIIHDPEDSFNYYSNKNILNHSAFKKSLPYCKGLFCMSKKLSKWIMNILKPNFFVETIYHPLSSKNLLQWKFEKFNLNKKIYQIGNWLRCTYSIYRLDCNNFKKCILPFNGRMKNELNHFLKRDKISLSELEKKSVIEVSQISDENYNKIFENSIIFLNLYSSTCNNVIIECIKANCPLLINRLEPIEDYLGKDYPFFYSNLEDAKNKLNDLELIKKTNRYLIDLDKYRFETEHFINSINKQINF